MRIEWLVPAFSLPGQVVRDMVIVHYHALWRRVAPAALVAPLLMALAIFVQMGLVENTGETFLALLFMVIAGPFLSHATIRAIRISETGDWRCDRRGGAVLLPHRCPYPGGRPGGAGASADRRGGRGRGHRPAAGLRDPGPQAIRDPGPPGTGLAEGIACVDHLLALVVAVPLLTAAAIFATGPLLGDRRRLLDGVAIGAAASVAVMLVVVMV